MPIFLSVGEEILSVLRRPMQRPCWRGGSEGLIGGRGGEGAAEGGGGELLGFVGLV